MGVGLGVQLASTIILERLQGTANRPQPEFAESEIR